MKTQVEQIIFGDHLHSSNLNRSSQSQSLPKAAEARNSSSIVLGGTSIRDQRSQRGDGATSLGPGSLLPKEDPSPLFSISILRTIPNLSTLLDVVAPDSPTCPNSTFAPAARPRRPRVRRPQSGRGAPSSVGGSQARAAANRSPGAAERDRRSKTCDDVPCWVMLGLSGLVHGLCFMVPVQCWRTITCLCRFGFMVHGILLQ